MERAEGNLEGYEWLSPTRVRLALHVPPSEEIVIRFRDRDPGAPVRFLAAGDPELDLSALSAFLDVAAREQPDFVWILGDLVQEQEWLFDVHTRLFERAGVSEVLVATTYPKEAHDEDSSEPPQFRRILEPVSVLPCS